MMSRSNLLLLERSKHKEIDWRGLKAMRNILIHEYAYVDADEMWKA